MFPAKFAYVAPTSVDEAVRLLAEGNGDAKILAGGHSLIPLLKLRLAQPSTLIDIGRIAGLRFIRREDGELRIGAMATYRDLLASAEVREGLPVLVDAANQIGDVQVRARGTLVGSLVHADPAGDMPAVALALGGTVVAQGPRGVREIAIDEFFVDMLTTQLAEDEIATEVRLPLLADGTRAAYEKFDQPASHYALTGVCAVVTLAEGGRGIESARIAITGVGPKAYRAESVESALAGTSIEEAAVKAACESAADGVDVQGDIHASAEYRAHLARVLARRAVLRAVGASTGTASTH